MRAWRLRHSFESVWRVERDEHERERILRFWLRASCEDVWTFRELRALLGCMLDEGRPVPATLQTWANEVAAGRRFEPEKVRGPKPDIRRDYEMLIGAVIGTEWTGWSWRRAYRELGKLYHCSPAAARDAVKRASKWAPGAWSGIPQK